MLPSLVQVEEVCVCVLPSLVQVDEEDHVVSETGQPMGRRHGDDEGKYIIDEGVESLGETMVNR